VTFATASIRYGVRGVIRQSDDESWQLGGCCVKLLKFGLKTGNFGRQGRQSVPKSVKIRQIRQNRIQAVAEALIRTFTSLRIFRGPVKHPKFTDCRALAAAHWRQLATQAANGTIWYRTTRRNAQSLMKLFSSTRMETLWQQRRIGARELTYQEAWRWLKKVEFTMQPGVVKYHSHMVAITQNGRQAICAWTTSTLQHSNTTLFAA